MPAKSKKSKKAVKQADSARARQLTRKQNRKRLKTDVKAKTLPSSWNLLKASLLQLKQNKKIFIGILVVYILLTIVFVRGVQGIFPLRSIQDTVTSSLGEDIGKWQQGAASYGLLIGSAATAPSEIESIYQTIIIVLISLALIWALRQTFDKKQKLLIRDAFYKSTHPLVPFLGVLTFMMIQLIPFGIAGSLYSTVQSGGIAVSGPEQILWLSVLAIGFFISAYFILASIFALYIVTLPDMRPLTALREAKALVRFRRWQITRKFLAMFLLGIVLSAVVLIPLIVFFAPLAEILYLLFSVLVLATTHAFIYRLYRELI